jgi:hypothetical protein
MIFAGGTVADHAVTRTTAQPAVAAAHAGEHFNGRGISWVGVAITCVGFIVGGAGFVPHMTWWLFWAGVAVTAVGVIVLLAAKTFSEDWY